MQQTAEATVSRLSGRNSGPPEKDSCIFSALRDSHFRSGQKDKRVKKLYIGNLPFSATEEQLNEWFRRSV